MTNPIDQCHCDLIYGLTASLKPQTILELGYGQGRSMTSVWQAIGFNQVRPTSYILLDDWSDHGGVAPDHLVKRLKQAWFKTEILSMKEAEFWRYCPIEPGSLDLLISDADHGAADETFSQALSLMRPRGIMIYHDVSNSNHVNLSNIPIKCAIKHISFLIFNQSSRPDEECERGLLVIQKS